MARLPVPGSDEGSWGQLLNEFLLASLSGDGSLKDESVTKSKLAAVGGTNGQVLSTDGSTLSWSTVSGSGVVPDATTSSTGLIRLAGDLGGTATNPTVPGLASKAGTTHTHAITDVTGLQASLSAKEGFLTAGVTSQYYRGDKSWQTLDKTAVGLPNVDNTSDATKNSASVTLTNKTISGASNTLSNIPQSAVTSLTTDLAAKAAISSLATVATSGSYDDLTNKPTIPVVPTITVAASAPSSPAIGDVWIDTGA